MIRRAAHTLKFATAAKRQKMDLFFVEYARVVNAFIELYWNADKLPGKANAEVYGKIDSWMGSLPSPVAHKEHEVFYLLFNGRNSTSS